MNNNIDDNLLLKSGGFIIVVYFSTYNACCKNINVLTICKYLSSYNYFFSVEFVILDKNIVNDCGYLFTLLYTVYVPKISIGKFIIHYDILQFTTIQITTSTV